MVGQVVRPGILGKTGKKLKTMEREETSKKRDDEDDPRGRRNQERKIRSKRVDRRRRDGQYSRPILRTVEKIPRDKET